MQSRKRTGFTLIELLVVIAIIAILAAILFPVFSKAKDAGKRAACMSNLKQLAIAAQNYAESWNCTYPPNRLNHWAAGTWIVPYTVYTAAHPCIGMRGLVPYVKNQKVFCCPSNTYFDKPGYWGEGSIWYSGYSYWGNYVRTDPYLGTSGGSSPFNLPGQKPKVAEDTGHYPYTVLLSDIVATNYIDSNSSNDTPCDFNSHPTKGLPVGGNFVYNDGHAKWKWKTDMNPEDSFPKQGRRFWF